MEALCGGGIGRRLNVRPYTRWFHQEQQDESIKNTYGE